MKIKTTRYLVGSLIGILFLCVSIFTFLAINMDKNNAETISEIGTTYMMGMSDRVVLHFETTMDYRLSHVEDLVEGIQPEHLDSETPRTQLSYSAQARGFECLALYSDEGSFDMIYGEQVEVTDPEPFLNSLRENEKKIAVGTGSTGEKVVLLGVPARYHMKEGGESIALVAGLSVDYFTKILALDQEDESLVYSHVIRKDGSFVIRSGDAFRDNYFDRLLALSGGKDQEKAKQCMTELKEAMEKEQPYSYILQFQEERRHIYCVSLPYSEWYLVTVMPYGSMDKAISDLNLQWMYMVFGGCSLILFALLLLFFWYFRLTKRQIRALEQAEEEATRASHAKSEFLSNMSHDIRTPMNAIVGMTAIAIANSSNEQQVQGCLKKIALSSRQLLGLINDVLDMSKIESGKMTLNVDQVSLQEIMDSIVSIVQPQIRAKKQHFDVFIHDITSEHVCCDSVRLNQVLLNLLSNAIKFTPEGGGVYLYLHEEESPLGEEYVRICLRVKDSGIGMSPEFKEKVFESFSREDRMRVHKTEGTGLGMAITKYIVDAMNGTIEVDSQKGQGTEFTVTLDLKKAMVSEENMHLPDWNLLVVDDDAQLCHDTVETLKSIGIQADWTQDGESALRLIEEHKDGKEAYQIILLDWKLPEMDGIETAREIRHTLKSEIPIILASAYDWGDIEEEARKAGVNGFVSKPLFKSTLYYGLRPFMGEEAGKEIKGVEEAVDFHGCHVLLAEDNDLNWEIAEELLSDLGLILERAENGKICVEKLEHSTPGFYSAILMDLRMPVMTGYEAAQVIRGLSRADAAQIPIIAMSADAYSEDKEKCLECGMNAHVAKPIDMQELSRILKKYL
ncbi:MAG: response regulator [Lachnospiraceae bacterium]|nr:response regulator [Lachnospiraceae bacterium]